MAALVGIIVAVVVALFARITGLDRDRAFYPVVLIVIASYYILFAVMAGGEGLFAELAIFALFAATAILGFRTSLWLVASGLIASGIVSRIERRCASCANAGSLPASSSEPMSSGFTAWA